MRARLSLSARPLAFDEPLASRAVELRQREGLPAAAAKVADDLARLLPTAREAVRHAPRLAGGEAHLQREARGVYVRLYDSRQQLSSLALCYAMLCHAAMCHAAHIARPVVIHSRDVARPRRLLVSGVGHVRGVPC